MPLCPTRLPGVVLFDSSRDIVGAANVKLALAVSDDINAIGHRSYERIGCGGWI